MRIAFVASEAVPFFKTGGLGDVVGALAAEMASRGHSVLLWLPYFRPGGREVRAEAAGEIEVPVGGRLERVRVLRRVHEGVEVRFLDTPSFSARPGLYQEEGKDYPDNAERFALLCRGALEGCRAEGQAPDLFHCHDWQAGLVPAYLRSIYAEDPAFARSASVFTIHNLAYQGNFPREALAAAGLPESEFTPERLEFFGQVSYMKAGLVHASQVNTVSPTYAGEIQSSPEFGMGLEGFLRRRAGALRGILNGLDVALWDPRSDSALPRRYGTADAGEGKRAAKRAVQEECGLEPLPDAPLLGAVARLDPQKGLDLALEVLPGLLDRGAQFVLVGRGKPELEKAFTEFARRRPRSVRFQRAFDDGFARRVYAGSDIYLMPSRFEPCGLGQLIAMRYGSLPVVTRTGGLADTVFEAPSASGPANGFVAEAPRADAFGAALDRALLLWRDAKAWAARRRHAMSGDYSWRRSASAYEELYAAARGGAR